MTGLLTRIFIKDSENVSNIKVRSAYGKLAGMVGIVCNAVLSVGKFIAGVAAGSVSIIADAVNNLSDASSGVIELLGFKLSERKADAEHPYGHGRYEYLAGLMVAVFVIVIGVELLRDSIVKIIHPEAIEFELLSAVMLAVSIPVKLWMMAFNKKIGNKINSETVKAACADSRNDVITTFAVLISCVVSRFSGLQLDGIIGALVAAFILYSGAGLVRDAVNPLLGAAPGSGTVEEIRRKILSYEGVIGTHDLMIHDYGPGRKFASAHVEVPAEMPLVKCHEVIDKIERDFAESGLPMLIHPDPIASGADCDERIPELHRVLSEIDGRLSAHDIRAVVCPDVSKVIFDCVIPPESGLNAEFLAGEINRRMRLKFPDCRCVIRFDYGYCQYAEDTQTVREGEQQ